MNPTEEWLVQPGGLAERLHSLRKAAGITGERLAQELGWVRSKISKIENGRQMPSADDIDAWTHVCGASGARDELLTMLASGLALHRQHRHELRRGQAALQVNLDELFRDATRVRNFETIVIPGLLQTAEYARYRMLENVRVYGGVEAEHELDVAVATRIRRQEVLYDTTKLPAAYMFGCLETVDRPAGVSQDPQSGSYAADCCSPTDVGTDVPWLIRRPYWSWSREPPQDRSLHSRRALRPRRDGAIAFAPQERPAEAKIGTSPSNKWLPLPQQNFVIDFRKEYPGYDAASSDKELADSGSSFCEMLGAVNGHISRLDREMRRAQLDSPRLDMDYFRAMMIVVTRHICPEWADPVRDFYA